LADDDQLEIEVEGDNAWWERADPPLPVV